MTVFINRIGSQIQIRVLGESGQITGDLTELVGPGQTALDRPYEFWQQLPTGRNDVDLEPETAG